MSLLYFNGPHWSVIFPSLSLSVYTSMSCPCKVSNNDPQFASSICKDNCILSNPLSISYKTQRNFPSICTESLIVITESVTQQYEQTKYLLEIMLSHHTSLSHSKYLILDPQQGECWHPINIVLWLIENGVLIKYSEIDVIE